MAADCSRMFCAGTDSDSYKYNTIITGITVVIRLSIDKYRLSIILRQIAYASELGS